MSQIGRLWLWTLTGRLLLSPTGLQAISAGNIHFTSLGTLSYLLHGSRSITELIYRPPGPIDANPNDTTVCRPPLVEVTSGLHFQILVYFQLASTGIPRPAEANRVGHGYNMIHKWPLVTSSKALRYGRKHQVATQCRNQDGFCWLKVWTVGLNFINSYRFF